MLKTVIKKFYYWLFPRLSNRFELHLENYETRKNDYDLTPAMVKILLSVNIDPPTFSLSDYEEILEFIEIHGIIGDPDQ